MLSPSLHAADLCDLGGALKIIESRGGSLVHVDVMDGSFVPEVSFGQPVMRAIKGRTGLPLDVHLMVAHPETQIASFAAAGADLLTFHVEAAVHHHRLLAQIRSLGKKAGIALVPSTPVSAVEQLLPWVDLVLLMTVDPGYSGQVFIEEMLEKIGILADIRKKTGKSFYISVDGGVNAQNVGQVIGAGADIIVAGSAFFAGTLVWEAVT
jgi:ribulose-phosphate 3-epimerase